MKKLVYPLLFILLSCGGNVEHEDHSNHSTNIPPTTDTAEIQVGQAVLFSNLTEGQKVNNPIILKMGVTGMEVQSTSQGVQLNKGHHHLLIDTVGYIPAGNMVPVVQNRIIHFGNGENEYTFNLPKGMHSLSLQFANGVHVSYGVRMSKTINIEVL